MASIPISLRNPQRSPFLNKTYTSVFADYVPQFLTFETIDPATNQKVKIYSLGFQERNMFPSYPTQYLTRPAAYGKTPSDGW